jgi:aryl-alcohol dehydrogenase-like predicted oxidoreductase
VHELKKHTLAQLRAQHAATRSLLPEVALYQIHSATLESGVLDKGDVLEALGALRDGQLPAAPGGDGPGAPRCSVGLSLSHPQVPTLERAISVRVGGAPLFSAVQCTFNLLDQSAAEALARAHAEGVFVIVKEALANGRLSPRAPKSARLELLRREAAALGVSVDALAIAWVLSHDFVGMCLSGAGSADQLRSNAAALKLVPLAPDQMERLRVGMAMPCGEYWAERRSLAWQ